MIRLLGLLAALALAALPASAQDGRAPMAMNLSHVNDWSAQQPFIDVMKTARPWIGHKPKQWGGVEYEELVVRGVLDENGWPTHIPDDLSSIGTLILTDLPEAGDAYAGCYVLRFEGTGIVEVGGAATNTRYGKNQVSFNFTPGGMVVVKIQRSDPARNGDYVRNITVIKQENQEAWASGEVFNPAWTRHMQGFAAIRFMNWMQTNNSTLSGWADRPRIDDFSYSWRGVPAEIMIRLANELGTDAWFTMPHRADAEYLRKFAELIRDRLAEDQRVYVEYSNEVWNWQFDQARWADRQARARWGQDNKWMQVYGMRAAVVARIWSQVFADDRDRLTTVISTQTGWLGLEEDALEAPLWVAEDPEKNRPPHSYADAYAVTGYFGYSLGADDKRNLVHRWLQDSRAKAGAEAAAKGLTGEAVAAYIAEHAYDAAVGWAAEEIIDGRHSGDPDDTLTDLLTRILPYHKAVADRYGLELIMYEGGSHVTGIGHQIDDDALTGFFTQLNYTPEMAALYDRLVTGWDDIGGGLFALYSDVRTPGKWGSWGHMRYLGDENPRWQMVLRLQAGRP